MPAPSFAEIQKSRDFLTAALAVMDSAVVDLYSQPWNLRHVAEQVRLADIALSRYCGVVARALEMPVKQASTLDEIQGYVEWLADNPKESDFAADRADANRHLCAEAAE